MPNRSSRRTKSKKKPKLSLKQMAERYQREKASAEKEKIENDFLTRKHNAIWGNYENSNPGGKEHLSIISIPMGGQPPKKYRRKNDNHKHLSSTERSGFSNNLKSPYLTYKLEDLAIVRVHVTPQGYLRCKKCSKLWKPQKDDNGDWVLRYWVCPNGCNSTGATQLKSKFEK